MKKIEIIAEIGWNHMGNMVLAKKMILQAKKVGPIHASFKLGQRKILNQAPGIKMVEEKFIRKQNLH